MKIYRIEIERKKYISDSGKRNLFVVGNDISKIIKTINEYYPDYKINLIAIFEENPIVI